jgi:hypothetical protein
MNIAFIIDNLANSQVSYDLVSFVNGFTKRSNDYNPVIFFQNNLPPVISPACMSMNISGLSGFTGTAVAIGLDSMDMLYKNNSRTDNWVLFWDIQWLDAVVDFCACINILKDFKIVARSESHRKIIKNFTGRDDIYLINNMDELYTCLTQKK